MILHIDFNPDDRNRLVQILGSPGIRGLQGFSVDLFPWCEMDGELLGPLLQELVEEDVPATGWFCEEDGDPSVFYASGAGYDSMECDDQQRLIVVMDRLADPDLPLKHFLAPGEEDFLRRMRETDARITTTNPAP